MQKLRQLLILAVRGWKRIVLDGAMLLKAISDGIEMIEPGIRTWGGLWKTRYGEGSEVMDTRVGIRCPILLSYTLGDLGVLLSSMLPSLLVFKASTLAAPSPTLGVLSIETESFQ
jgi:hypothetical protein